MDSTSITRRIEYKSLFQFSDPLASRPLRLESFEDEWLTEDIPWRLADGSFRPRQPLKLRAYMGGQATDVLWSGLVVVFCVSMRVIELLKDDMITGCSTYPVEVHDRQGVFLPGYQGFSIIGPTCQWDKSRSEIIRRPPVVPNGPSQEVYHGLYFDESQWDGSDFFRVSTGACVVTDRVRRLFKRNKIANVRFESLSKIDVDTWLG